jgi:hypothetical protein
MHGSKEAGRPHWLVAKHGVSGMEVLTFHLDGGTEALAVFSVEEETRKFLDFRPEASGEGWKARQTWPGELASVLYGPCSAVKKVTLDPLPEAVDKGKSVGLQAMDRNDFLRKLLGEGPQSIRLVSSRSPGSYKGLLHRRVA